MGDTYARSGLTAIVAYHGWFYRRHSRHKGRINGMHRTGSRTAWLGFIIAGLPFLAVALAGLGRTASAAAPARRPVQPAIHAVFVIVMENHNWSSISTSPSAPYIRQTLLRLGAHATQYYNPPGSHPSLPNYLWLEAGTNFGISNDDP